MLLIPCVMVYYIVSGLFLMFFWCRPCMAINVNVQYNGGLLPDIILLTQFYLHRGTCLNAMKRFCILQPLIPPKRFEFFSPITGGCSEGLLGLLCFFFKIPGRNPPLCCTLINRHAGTEENKTKTFLAHNKLVHRLLYNRSRCIQIFL